MTDARLLFLGRTGVGKSSLINFLAGEKRCDTDPYRACTKEPTTISVKYGVNKYDLIDTPGLCEGGEEIDSHYLSLIDKHLVDDKTSPILVFKSDDSRLRSEDYKLLKTLIKRYGNRVLSSGALMLTFAGNLPNESNSKVHKRVKQITTAIYGIQTSLGNNIFNGFPRIALVDSELRSFFDVSEPHNQISEKLLISAIRQKQYEGIAQRLGVNPELSECMLDAIIKWHDTVNFKHDKILQSINKFPFHNLIEDSPDSNESLNPAMPKMTKEPKSIYELAQLLSEEGYDDNSITIDNGCLIYKSTQAYRKLLDSGLFADCISVVAYSWKVDQDSLGYMIHYKISDHQYQGNGETDIEAILKSAEDAVALARFKPSSYRDFRRMIQFKEYLINGGLEAFKKSVEEALANEELWTE